jgi:hypothetical protein
MSAPMSARGDSLKRHSSVRKGLECVFRSRKEAEKEQPVLNPISRQEKGEPSC